jgi:D-3-phosphoglycerate dehydrogenase / 2-oxoglutarate reductase
VSRSTRRVVLTAGGAEQYYDELRALDGVEVVERYELEGADDAAQLTAVLEGAWAVVAGSDVYSRAVLAALPELAAIVRWGTGSDAIDVEAATAGGVAVVTTPGANADAVADLALALMLACLRDLPGLDAAVRSGAWRRPGLSRDLAGARVGVVGLGAIGRGVVRRVSGFGCPVIATEPQPDLEFCARYEVELAGLDAMLPCVDVLTLHAALTDATRHMVGARELALLPAHAVVINTSRGPLIDEDALVAALEAGAIGSVGLDVFEEEPLPADHPLTTFPNVVLAGHAASFTQLAVTRTGAAVVAHLRELLAGTLPATCLNPRAWASPSGRG